MSIHPIAFGFCVGVLLTLYAEVTARPRRRVEEDWDHHIELNETYNLYWTVENDNITFKLEVETKGWLGFGLSLDGGLTGSDIIISWVVNNRTTFYEYHASNDAVLTIDNVVDWYLMYGYENETHTVIQFYRALDTCDEFDIAVTNDTMMIIFAEFPEDPSSPYAVNYRQTVWGSYATLLLEPKINTIPIPDDVQYFDVRAPNITIPDDQRTFHYCRLVKLPSLDRKHHVIEVAPIIRPQNVEIVHHFFVYMCSQPISRELQKNLDKAGGHCHAPNIPNLYELCIQIIAVWAIGGGATVYPNQAGLPVGERPDQYVLLHTHYDNPEFRYGTTDDSGVRFYFTPNLRTYDAGILSIDLGEYVNPTAVLPPRQEEFTLAAHARPECLAVGMQEGGINIFAVILHSHMLAKRLRLRHFRGNKELHDIASDMNYKVEHQFIRHFPWTYNIQAGDQLTMECSYDTRTETGSTFFNLEMCTSLVFYYPAMSTAIAESNVPVELVAGLTGMNLTETGYSSLTAFGPPNPNYEQYLLGYPWPDSSMCMIKEAMRYSPQDGLCFLVNGTIMGLPRTAYPEPIIPYKQVDKCTGRMVLQRENFIMQPLCDNNQTETYMG